MLKSLLLPALFAPLMVTAAPVPVGTASPNDDRQRFHLHEEGERAIGYSQAVRAGNTLYISGSVGSGEMKTAIKEAYDKLQKTLAAHGLGFGDVVKETVFATNLDAFIANKELRKEYYSTDYPTATWVQVERLYMPEFVVEVELIATFPPR